MTELTIIIPAFNEQDKIVADILAADRYLIDKKIDGQIVVIDDGSSDNTSENAKKTSKSIDSKCLVLRSNTSMGKGYAVRKGILESESEFVVFADSGGCVPFSEINDGLALIRAGKCQIAHGSRKMPGCEIVIPQSFYRQLCSKLFHWFLIHDVKGLTNLTDTQCGFKIYRGDIARQLYTESTIDGFMFDIEKILLALSKGYNICEFPVNWTCDPDSRLKPAHEIMRVFTDLVKLKHRFRALLKSNQS